jgi:hypothetical protein
MTRPTLGLLILIAILLATIGVQRYYIGHLEMEIRIMAAPTTQEAKP